MQILPSLQRLTLGLFMTLGITHADPIDVGEVLGFTPGIHGAVELTFPSEVGKYYQVQISADMATWDNEGYSVKGTGGQISVLARTRNLSTAYYRLRDDGSADNVAPVGPAGPPGSDAAVTAENIAAAGGALANLSNVDPVSGRDALGVHGASDKAASVGLRNLMATAGFSEPISVVVIGDSFNIGFYAGLERYHIRGGFRTKQLNAGGDSGVTIHDGKTEPGHGPKNYNLSPDGAYYEIADGGNLTCGHLQFGTPGAADQVHYTLFPGTGTAQLQFLYSGNPFVDGDWVNVGSPIDTTQITSVQCGTLALPFGYNSTVRCRVKAQGGTVNGWIGQGMEGPGIMIASFATDGQSMAQTMSVGEARWKAMLTAWGADLIVSSWYDGRFVDAAGTDDSVGDDNWADGGPFDRAHTWSKEAVPTVDWLYVSSHQVDSESIYARVPAVDAAALDAAYASAGVGTNAEDRNRYSLPFTRDFALARLEAFVDCYHLFPSREDAVAAGMYADPLHLSDVGKAFKAAHVFRESGLSSIFAAKAAGGLNIGGLIWNRTQNFGQGSGLGLYSWNGLPQPIFVGSVNVMDQNRPDAVGGSITYNSSNGALRLSSFVGGGQYAHAEFRGYGIHPATPNQGALGGQTSRWAGAFVGGMSTATATKTGDYTLMATDHKIFCDAMSGGFTLTMQAASNDPGRNYIIQKTDNSSNEVVVGSVVTLTSEGQTAFITSDGTSWRLTNLFTP